MQNFIKSTSIVLFLSALGALGANMIHLNWIATFILLFVFQFILFSFIGNMITVYFTEKTKQKQLDVLEPLSTILECAYCSFSNLMTFFPNKNERKEFECEKCKKKNLVNINFSVARTTEHVNVPNLTGIPLMEADEK